MGVGGDPDQAKLIDASVRIFTNTVGRPLYSDVNGQITPTVLASYGLFVSADGLLESLANEYAPTKGETRARSRWLREHVVPEQRRHETLEMLYRSAYTVEVVFGNESQQLGGTAELVPNYKGGVESWVGMSMVPSIWLVNFTLLYILNPAWPHSCPPRGRRFLPMSPAPSSPAPRVTCRTATTRPISNSDLPRRSGPGPPPPRRDPEHRRRVLTRGLR